eukprot:4259264-Pleurochrysis_carterae.AAC.1
MHGLHQQAAILCVFPVTLPPQRQPLFSKGASCAVPPTANYFLRACLWPPSYFCGVDLAGGWSAAEADSV